MKKVLSVFLAIMVCLSMNPTAFADNTKRHGALEFSELYTARLSEAFAYMKIDSDIQVSKDMVWGQLDGDTITVSFNGGIIDIFLEDFTVLSLDAKLYDFRKTDDENSVLMTQCIAAFSALEYDDIEDSLFDMYSRAGIGSGAKNATEESFRIWSESIIPTFEKTITKAVKSGDEILLYSGNYDYYVVYFSKEGNGVSFEELRMVARSR